MRLEHDKVLSNFAFNFNLRHYNQAARWFRTAARGGVAAAVESLQDLGVVVTKQDAVRDVAKAYELRWSNFVARAGVEGGVPVTAADLPVPDDKTLQSLVNHPDEEVRRELRARWDPARFNSAFRTRMVWRCSLTYETHAESAWN